MLDKNSFFRVWPKVRDLQAVVKPRTICVEIPQRTLQGLLDGKALPETIERKLDAAGELLDYPLFMRTDLASAKHDYESTCHVPDRASLIQHLVRIIEFNEMAGFIGLNYSGLVLRELVQLDVRFLAFRNMPVAPEWRVFVRNGEITCKHFYWPEEAIENGHHSTLLPDDWKSLLINAGVLLPADHEYIDRQARLIAASLGEEWSLDFARRKDGEWLFIDAATYGDSYHAPCRNSY